MLCLGRWIEDPGVHHQKHNDKIEETNRSIVKNIVYLDIFMKGVAPYRKLKGLAKTMKDIMGLYKQRDTS